MARIAETAAASAEAPSVKRRHVAAAVIGNWLEFYDFTVYAYFAVQIGDAFFPARSEFASTMASLITFGAGFICRPLGAVVIGRYADRAGRRPAMLASFAMMGLAILGMVFVPPYRQIGVLAPILVVVLRVVQGFALGGEVGPTTAYLIEAAPSGKRGLYGAWQSASQSLASISGGLIGALLAYLLSKSAFGEYGWRIAFLVGGLVLPVGFIIRRSLPETRDAPEEALDVHPDLPWDASAWQVILGQWRIVLMGLGLITGATVSTYVFIYMTTYAQTTLHMGVRIALWVTVVNGTAGLVASLGGGWLSDRIGRKPLMIWPRLAFLAATLPVFMMVTHNRSPVVLLALLGGLNVLANLASVPAVVALTEAMRKDVRSLAMASVYATAVAVFGGTTQPIVHWLDATTHNPMAVAWYLSGATVIALAVSLMMPETAKVGRSERQKKG